MKPIDPASPIPLRWRVRWFLRGMASILVPLTTEEMREEVDRCVAQYLLSRRIQRHISIACGSVVALIVGAVIFAVCMK